MGATKMRVNRFVAAIVLLGSVSGGAMAFPAVTIHDFDSYYVGSAHDATGYGWSFTPRRDLVLVALGAFIPERHDAAGTQVPYGWIRLWDSNGNPLAQSGSGLGRAEDYFGYSAVDPVLLHAGQTYIGGVGGGGPFVNWIDGLELDFHPSIGPVAGHYGFWDTHGALAFGGNPAAQLDIARLSSTASSGRLYFGQNLKFASVPEPATLSTLGIGILLTLWVRARSRPRVRRS